MEYNLFCFKSVRGGILKLWPLLYIYVKVHKNVVNAMVTCNHKWPTNNICVSSMRLTYSSHDLLFHSESIHIDFKLTMLTVQELWPFKRVYTNKTGRSLGKIIQNCILLQFIKMDVTDEILSIQPLTQNSLKESLLNMEQIGFCFISVRHSIQKLQSSFYRRAENFFTP